MKVSKKEIIDVVFDRVSSDSKMTILIRNAAVDVRAAFLAPSNKSHEKDYTRHDKNKFAEAVQKLINP